jgi:hypothetical protein
MIETIGCSAFFAMWLYHDAAHVGLICPASYTVNIADVGIAFLASVTIYRTKAARKGNI